MPEFTYNISSSFNDGVDITRFTSELATAGFIVYSAYCSEDKQTCVVNVNLDDKPAVDAVVAAHVGCDSLYAYKSIKFAKIDGKTYSLIENGFQYANKTFSLSQHAQAKLVGVHQVRDDPMMTYPIKWNTKDDNDYYSISDIDDLHLFYMTAVGTYKAHVDSGTALKDLVRAATSKAEVDAIVDPR